MLVLTFSTGVLDAVGFLGLGGVFAGNMTGNVVLLGLGAGGSGHPVLGPAAGLGGFVAGAVLAGRLLRHETEPWSTRVTATLVGVGTLVLALGVALLVGVDGEAATAVVAGLLAAALGTQAGAARVVAVPELSTVVITSTITALAGDSRLGSGKSRRDRPRTVRRFAAVALIALGALVGAMLLRWHVAAGILLAASLILLVALAEVLRASVARLAVFAARVATRPLPGLGRGRRGPSAAPRADVVTNNSPRTRVSSRRGTV